MFSDCVGLKFQQVVKATYSKHTALNGHYLKLMFKIQYFKINYLASITFCRLSNIVVLLNIGLKGPAGW